MSEENSETEKKEDTPTTESGAQTTKTDTEKKPEVEERLLDINPDQDYIVVAEDSPPNRNILVHLLKKLEFGVIEAEDGQVAFDAMEKYPEAKIVAVLSDIMMPNLNGIELLNKVRSHDKFKDLPFVLITAVADKEYIIEAKSLNVNGYILKPVTFDKVFTKLKSLFPGKEFPNLK